MKKITILFCMESLLLGGAHLELITISKKFDPNKYDITLCFIDDRDKSLINEIPKNVKLIIFNNKTIIKYKLKEKKYFDIIKILLNKLFKLKIKIDLPKLHETYDYAVCYSFNDHEEYEFIANNVTAIKKYGWIHDEFRKQHVDPRKSLNLIHNYDKIIGVSYKLTEEFKELCPEVAHKAITIHNILEVDKIIEKSKDLSNVEADFLNDKNIKLLSVGRVCRQKGFDIAIEISRLLKDSNIKFTWYIIGEGCEFDNLQNLISKYGLEKEFVLLGRKDNPYPYFANCDIYVQPSRFEAFCITVAEAKVFKKPIIATNFAGADEQIENGLSGIIVDDCNPKSIFEAIKNLIENKELRNNIMKNIKNLDDEANWKKIEALFNE